MQLTYKEAGVDVEEGQRAVQLMKKHVKETFNDNVVGDLGSFGGLLRLSGAYESPVLVAGTDGVGTKLKIAFLMDKHDTVGQDLVAMCVNDILCQGATPLFFLDYLATGKLNAEKTESIVKGVTDGCKLSSMPLLGGETAEMPGFYQDGEYDMAGFAVGVVDEKKIVSGKDIEAGDLLIGIPSSGVHSNGFSLVRKLCFDALGLGVDDYVSELGASLGESLLTPTKIYVKPVLNVIESLEVRGMIHMTGGGFFENIPRMIPQGLGVKIDLGSWPSLPIFDFIMSKGNVALEEMFATFNMGIGFIIIVKPDQADQVKTLLQEKGETAYVIGHVTDEKEGVTLCQK